MKDLTRWRRSLLCICVIFGGEEGGCSHHRDNLYHDEGVVLKRSPLVLIRAPGGLQTRLDIEHFNLLYPSVSSFHTGGEISSSRKSSHSMP